MSVDYETALEWHKSFPIDESGRFSHVVAYTVLKTLYDHKSAVPVRDLAGVVSCPEDLVDMICHQFSVAFLIKPEGNGYIYAPERALPNLRTDVEREFRKTLRDAVKDLPLSPTDSRSLQFNNNAA
jgi:hypothetical protein